MRKRYTTSLILGALIGASTLVAGPGSVATAANYSLSVNTPVHIGVDAVGGNSSPGYDITPCQLGGGPGPIAFGVGGTPAQVRVEMYPGNCGYYDGWSNVGGVHFEANLGGGNLGAINMPVDGQGGAFAYSRRHLVVHGDRYRTRDRRQFPDRDRISRSAGAAPVERTGGVRIVRVDGESWRDMERRRRWQVGTCCSSPTPPRGARSPRNVYISSANIPTIDLDAEPASGSTRASMTPVGRA